MEQKIRTVLDDVPVGKLGWCQCHEHVFLERGKSCGINPALCMDDAALSYRELQSYAAAGGKAYVDAQPGYFGRMAERMVAGAQKSGVRIIASTGFHKLCFCDDDRFLQQSELVLTDFFVREIEQGMLSSMADGAKQLDAKAGVVKVAVDAGGICANATYEKLFAAAVQAAGRTGAALLAHFEPDTDAFALLRLMERHNLVPQKLIACHLDRARYDVGYHSELAQAGVFLEYDTIHRLRYHDDETEIRLIEAMLQGGYQDNLLLSLDTTAARLKSYGGEIGLDYILTIFSGQLAEQGIHQNVLDAIMIGNAARALEF